VHRNFGLCYKNVFTGVLKHLHRYLILIGSIMQNQVIANIEIEDQTIEHYSSVIISQKFNEHHTFSIRIKYDVLEKAGSFSLSNAQKLIGKSAVIKLLQANTLDIAYEFHGLVCEISVEQSENFSSDLVIKGYSPTILLENGPNFNSFYKKKLQDIVGDLTKSLSQVNCSVNNKPEYKTQIAYICQYRESGFHFLNRLSSHFSEWFYYDGQQLNFGKPAKSPNIEVTYGVDVQNLQMKLRVLPLTFSAYSYHSKDDSFITADAPANIDGLDEYASFVLKESNNLFSEPVSFPVKQRIESKSDLDGFLKQQKTAMAAKLEVLSATSDNPTVCIGAIADVKISVLSDNNFLKEDGGKFLITSVDHYITDNGKYYNSFEGIPSGINAIPVDNIIVPMAEPQIATVKDNKDPDNIGRVRVQMLWQQPTNEMTDWINVITPDAGGGKDGAKNRGLVVVPETGDQVLVCFRYNDPDRPFVLGSMFNGKTGGGGGSGNKTKSLTVLSGSVVNLDGDAINIIDAKGNAVGLDGTGNISISSSASINLSCGKGSVFIDKDGNIIIKGVQIVLDADDILLSSGKGDIVLNATKDVNISGKANAVLGSDAKVSIAATGDAVEIQGKSKVAITSTGPLELQGGATASLKAGTVQIN
jgi:hypothetical protein